MVLDTYVRVSNDFIGNANSLHYLGFRSHKLMDEVVGRVASFVHAKSSEVIFTSGASESNNMALIGTSFAYPCRNKIIVTTLLEHSSILDSCSYLKKLGFEIMYLRLDNDGHVDITNLKELLALNPMIVSIGYVNSEVGIV
ncbi:MAG: aminotransferase class V-fold PLP-dependent enzyme, partial [Clostridia bacterium]